MEKDSPQELKYMKEEDVEALCAVIEKEKEAEAEAKKKNRNLGKTEWWKFVIETKNNQVMKSMNSIIRNPLFSSTSMRGEVLNSLRPEVDRQGRRKVLQGSLKGSSGSSTR